MVNQWSGGDQRNNENLMQKTGLEEDGDGISYGCWGGVV
jgi:hypothetical protein